MSALLRTIATGLQRGAAISCCIALAVLPMTVAAQDRDAPHSMSHMEHDAMPAAAGSSAVAPASTMDDMQHHHHPQATTSERDTAASTPAPDRKPSGERSPDYSDGIAHGPMKGMDMADDQPLGMLRIDQLEYTHGKDADGMAWDAQAWYGNDIDKLWLRSEGQRNDGHAAHGDAEVLWNHAVAAFWDVQSGLRHDFGEGPDRTWAAFGVQGLAPYWFELQATAYVGASGRTAARFRADYDLRFTQRLILQPQLELDLYGRDDPARRVGSGLSEARASLRLRYEIRRRFAPYIGVVWTRRYGATAGYARQDGIEVLDRQFVAGLRFWF